MDVQLPQVILVIPTYLLITAKKKKTQPKKRWLKYLKHFQNVVFCCSASVPSELLK